MLCIWKHSILKYKFNWNIFINFLSILDHFQEIKKFVKK